MQLKQLPRNNLVPFTVEKIHWDGTLAKAGFQHHPCDGYSVI
jgi:hypothetical protein